MCLDRVSQAKVFPTTIDQCVQLGAAPHFRDVCVEGLCTVPGVRTYSKGTSQTPLSSAAVSADLEEEGREQIRAMTTVSHLRPRHSYVPSSLCLSAQKVGPL